jgi:uroporphyrinogen decarboxylase
MNSRERVQAALQFDPPDRLPANESPWEQTAAAWYEQGIPQGMSLADYFGFDIAMMYLDTSPQFEMKVLDQAAGNITYEDRFGYTITKPAGVSATMRFHRHVTIDRTAWGSVRQRFTLQTGPVVPARIDDSMYFGHFDPYPTWEQAVKKFRRLRDTGRYLLFMCYGPWEATWRHRGMENLLIDVATDPDWVADMADTYQTLVIEVLGHCLELGMKPDGVLTADDLGTAHGPLMSPQMWAAVFKPQVARLGSFLQRHDIAFWLHSDGGISPLIDSFVDAGIDVLNPLEAKAGMDVVDLRQRYGKRLAFYGNIDATKMGGPPSLIRAELERKIPQARGGGYIFHSDHSCPPDVSLGRYQWILATARAIFAKEQGPGMGGAR